MTLIHRYFQWLQAGNPVGTVEKYPESDDYGQSSLKGVYIAGDLTGIPLLKTASESGAALVRNFKNQPDFVPGKEGIFDVLIVGAGPAGVAAALECEKLKLTYQVLEATQLFNTIENFPKGKLILAKPDDMEVSSQLIISNGNKETLLKDMKEQLKKRKINLSLGTMVKKISRSDNTLELETNTEPKKSQRVILAIGKSGNARSLKVPGENLPKVFNKLFDPGEFQENQVLVVGGGDSALEASVALARAGNKVIHSYRGENFSRPKQENLRDFEAETAKGIIEPLFGSKILEIRPESVKLTTAKGEKIIPNDVVFSLIGRELPLSFFKRSKIKMEGEKGLSWYVFLVAMLSFFTMLYFGKSGFAMEAISPQSSFLEKIFGYLSAPFNAQYSWTLKYYSWYNSLNFLLGWMGSLVWMISGLWSLLFLAQRREKYFGTAWNRIKYGYFIFVGVFFSWIYFSTLLGQKAGWTEEPTYWYSLLYCSTMALFGLRRIQVRKTRYIKYQVSVLVFLQVFFLFLLPFHLYEPLIAANFSKDSYLISEVFPGGKWSSFGLILFWPLNVGNFGSSTFWTWFPFVQTFGILLFLVLRFGKGAYCSWICSCGGMAETLGDEYRTKTPHGPTAKRLENIGQIVLAFAFLATAIMYLSKQGILPKNNSIAYTIWGLYKISIDVIFAGVLGLGVYFFLGGRIWCRYGCPLAALMHIYTRFSKYRIVSEKKKCISCNICTKVCHMGIDVMSYANKGVPLNDAECVRCSACVQSCPTEVLSFATLEKGDTKNREKISVPEYGKEDWRAGIR